MFFYVFFEQTCKFGCDVSFRASGGIVCYKFEMSLVVLSSMADKSAVEDRHTHLDGYILGALYHVGLLVEEVSYETCGS